MEITTIINWFSFFLLFQLIKGLEWNLDSGSREITERLKGEVWTLFWDREKRDKWELRRILGGNLSKDCANLSKEKLG